MTKFNLTSSVLYMILDHNAHGIYCIFFCFFGPNFFCYRWEDRNLVPYDRVLSETPKNYIGGQPPWLPKYRHRTLENQYRLTTCTQTHAKGLTQTKREQSACVTYRVQNKHLPAPVTLQVNVGFGNVSSILS